MTDLLTWLASLPARDRDTAIEERLGISQCEHLFSMPQGDDLLGYHPSGVSAIVLALSEVGLTADDVFIDLGSGLGKVVLLANLLTGVTARGIELQPVLVDRARQAAARSGVDARFTAADVRDADLDDGTVFFLYTPFTGSVLAAALDRLHDVARRKAIVVCALAIDLDRVEWLRRRDVDAFWLSIYDSDVDGVDPRPVATRVALHPFAAVVARELELSGGE